jgi:hypothetical protein
VELRHARPDDVLVLPFPRRGHSAGDQPREPVPGDPGASGAADGMSGELGLGDFTASGGGPRRMS